MSPALIECEITHKGYAKKATALKRVVKQAATLALQNKKRALTIVLATDAEIKTLNHQFRGKNKPTNVLSFPSYESAGARTSPERRSMEFSGENSGSIYIGDIMISLDTIAKEAKAQTKKFEHHLAHMVVHGVLHLLGHDHEKDKDADKMEALEVKLLKKLGIGNPYL